MKLLSQVVTSPLMAQLASVEQDIAGSISHIMAQEADQLKLEMRDEVLEAGMNQRLANTWRSKTYPEGDKSLNPAGFVWSKSPLIIDSYVRGAEIRPVNGAKWLWIPSKNVPRRRRAGSYSSTLGKRARGTAMSPEEVELHFNSDLNIAFEGGKGFAFIDVVSGISGGFRSATAGRLKGRTGQAPRRTKSVLMFTLVRGVKMPKLFDLQAPADRAAARIAQRFAAIWS